MRALGFVILSSVFGASSAQAHDLWVEPSGFRIEAKAPLSVELKVGSGDDVRVVEVKPERVIRLEALSGTSSQNIEKGTTQGLEGDVLLVYRSNHAYIEMPAKKFQNYLRHEGLREIVELRSKLGQTDSVGKESYARNCKTLVSAGTPGKGWSRKVGLPLEIVPLADPRRPGKRLRFSVFLHNKPLPGARLDLMRLDNLKASVEAVSGADGTVSFAPPDPGHAYLVATTYMKAIEAGQGTLKGDWASEWSTFAFFIDD